MNLKGTKKKNQVSNVNIFEQQELLKKIEVVRENLTASTWHELETKGKFDKNAKLSFICDDMLILGCDVGSEEADNSVSPLFHSAIIRMDLAKQRNRQ